MTDVIGEGVPGEGGFVKMRDSAASNTNAGDTILMMKSASVSSAAL